MRQAQGRVLGKREVKAKAKTWLRAKSKSMTTLFGFYGATALMIVGTALFEVCAPATFACIALAGYNVYRLNVENPEEKGGEA